ncbi:hypothetical protein LSTR_LSTR009803 [Laodelphax striatellus]|uniref:Uncharacterized protein n=1 Tax=Laodelphax striatellus TaxID=195883 RepID=A0A482XN97_LAOST|nr:hypothetical protein LSTR_LSTR009803 [Laodelphax striatellus]
MAGSSDLITTATSALRRLHFKSAGAYRTPPSSAAQVPVSPKVVLVGSSSVSVESSSAGDQYTSTDSSNTVITMVTVTDGGDDCSLDFSVTQPVTHEESAIRITNNILEDMLDKTPVSSLDREEEFFSASSTEDAPKPASEEVKMIFLGRPSYKELDDEDDELLTPLMQYAVPREDETPILEDAKTAGDTDAPPGDTDPDTSLEWYTIKMRQPSVPHKNREMSNTKRLKLLSKRYAKSNMEDDRLHRARGSSGFAAEQMTVESEDSFTSHSPPVPDSPTGKLIMTETKFTFEAAVTGPDEEDFENDNSNKRARLMSNDDHKTKETVQAEEKKDTTSENIAEKDMKEKDECEKLLVGDEMTSPSGGNSRIESSNSLALERVQRKPRSERRSISMESAPTLRRRDSGEIRTATIVVQQASVTGGSPDASGEFNHLHDFEIKYITCSHHSRSQSVKTPRGVNSGGGGTGVRHRPNYLCLPQQRSRVASMPNTGVEEEYYRLRHFSITGKGVVNRGDSLKSRRSRSNTSVASSNSSHSTEQYQMTGAGAGAVQVAGSYPGSARTSATASLASSRESSCASCPGITAPYRVMMLGSAGVGKTSLISQFMTSEYLHAYDTSIDDEFGEKSVSVLLDGEESELTFIDHPSSEMSPEDCLTAYSSAHAFCVVYSTSDRASFRQAEESLQALWKMDNIRLKAVILVGNKTDLVRSRVVSTQDGKVMATNYDCKFIETSVGINHNVDELLVGILTQIRLKQENPPETNDSHRQRCRSRSPLGGPVGGFRKYRGQRTSASLKVKGLLSKVWARDSKSKSCENLHVL